MIGRRLSLATISPWTSLINRLIASIRFGGGSPREQDFAVQIACVRKFRPRLQHRPHLAQGLVRSAVEVQHRRERVARFDVFGMRGQFGPKRVHRIGETPLLEINDAERGVRLRHVWLQRQRPFERFHGGVEIPLLGVGFSEHDIQLGAAAVRGDEARERRFRVGGTTAADQRDAVGSSTAPPGRDSSTRSPRSSRSRPGS